MNLKDVVADGNDEYPAKFAGYFGAFAVCALHARQTRNRIIFNVGRNSGCSLRRCCNRQNAGCRLPHYWNTCRLSINRLRQIPMVTGSLPLLKPVFSERFDHEVHAGGTESPQYQLTQRRWPELSGDETHRRFTAGAGGHFEPPILSLKSTGCLERVLAN